ncbi:hypothetical protein [Micromonospora humida]|uniref:hypothetical protein n=1 Tax=Micromonospora humida TaxID=2809018 RepID=UPI003414907B
MSARRFLLLPAAVVLFVPACSATEAPRADATASAPTATATAAPSGSSTVSAPATAAPTDGTPATRPTVTAKAAGGVASANCPSGTDLQKLIELPKGMTFGNVECVKGWAGAVPQGPKTGDGVYLFHYTAGTGWKYYGEGSGYDCRDLGLTEPAPFCISG